MSNLLDNDILNQHSVKRGKPLLKACTDVRELDHMTRDALYMGV